MYYRSSPRIDYREYAMPKTYKPLEEALRLVKLSVQSEREDELFYDYLISMAPTQEEKEIITTIRNDERKHNQMYRQIYRDLTGEEITAPSDVPFQKPASYLEGIRKALFGELAAMERYRIIRAGLPSQYYRDMVFEILTDELKHADKYNYILTKNIPMTEPIKTTFTTEEVLDLARQLDLDFSKTKFDVDQFKMGLETELEHDRKYYPTDITSDNPLLTGKVSLAHLKEFPDYYTRLKKLEEEAKAYWQEGKNRQPREFTLTELSQFDGSKGQPAYVAVNGIIYDVSQEKTWGGGSHFGLIAGKDLTEYFNSCHGTIEILNNLPKVGILKE